MPTHTIKTSPDLGAAVKARAKALGYPSVSAYYKGLARYDMLVQGAHPITLPWAALSLAEQDGIDAKVLKLTQSGVGERGQLLRHIVGKEKQP